MPLVVTSVRWPPPWRCMTTWSRNSFSKYSTVLPCTGSRCATVGHVVEHFLRMQRDRAHLVDLPAHPLRIVPLREVRQAVIGARSPDRARPRCSPCARRPSTMRMTAAFGIGAVVVRDVVALAVGAEAPRVIRAADRVALDLPVLDDIGACRCGQMRAHVRAVRVEHHDAAALAAVDHEVLGKEPHRQPADP